eukprot:TRINITY_DN4815_c0_g1_i2.p1 TRINITY_DN4815_c0_g1~~TRINITY_DN4815_c0_g1_i2.p1  ORF type:complete len:304 (+),score=47.55 TRINITY_DN4815_c0_g1_i2:12-923(+)
MSVANMDDQYYAEPDDVKTDRCVSTIFDSTETILNPTEESYRTAVNTIISQYETLILVDNSGGKIKKGTLQYLANTPIICTVSCHQIRTSGFIIFRPKKKNDKNVHQRPEPHEVIHLKYGKLQLSENNCFTIHTPIASYPFRAKHAAALNEWIMVIAQASPKTLPEEILRRVEEIRSGVDEVDDPNAPPIKPYLVYTKNGKQKIMYVTDQLILIGRANIEGPCNTKKGEKMLSISDTRVSREHGKILFTNNNKCTYVDLGSTRGTELNGVKMSKKVLAPGDRIRIGKTVVHYEGFIVNTLSAS